AELRRGAAPCPWFSLREPGEAAGGAGLPSAGHHHQQQPRRLLKHKNRQEPSVQVSGGVALPTSRHGGGRPAPPLTVGNGTHADGTSILSITLRLAFLAHSQRAAAGGPAPRPSTRTTSVPSRQRRPD